MTMVGVALVLFGVVTAGWENVNPERSEFPLTEVVWTAPEKQWRMARHFGDGAVVEIGRTMLRPCVAATYETDADNDTVIYHINGEMGAFTTKSASTEYVWTGRYARQFGLGAGWFAYVPAGVRYADRLVYGNAQLTRRIVIKIPQKAK